MTVECVLESCMSADREFADGEALLTAIRDWESA